MVNMASRGVQAPKLETPAAPQSGGLQMPTPQGGVGAIAQSLGELNATLAQLGQRANVAAGKEEGAAAGLQAGQTGVAPAFRRDGSVRGEAFDQAAMESGLAVLETKLRTDLSNLANSTLDDPNAWTAGADKIVNDTLSALQSRDPQMATQMALIASQARASGDIAARKRMVELGQSARKGAIDGLIETRGNAVINLARQDQSNPQTQAALAAETEGFIQTLAKLGPRGAFEAGGRQFPADDTRAGQLMPEQVSQTLRDLTKKLAIETSLGAFDRAPNVKAKREMLAALDADISKGTGLAQTLGLDTARQAYDAMQGRLADAVGAENVIKGEIVDDLQELDAIARSGFAPDAAKLGDVLGRANATGDADLIGKATELQAVASLSPQLNAMSVPALDAWIKNKEKAMAANATPQNLSELGLARDVYSRKLAHIQTNAAEMAAGIPPMPFYSRARGRFSIPGDAASGGGRKKKKGGSDSQDDDGEDIFQPLKRLTMISGHVGKKALGDITWDPTRTRQDINARVKVLEARAVQNGAKLQANALLLGPEKTALAEAIDQGGPRALEIATSVMAGGGRYGVSLLSDVSANGYGMALASALRQRGGRAGDLAAQGQLLYKSGVRMPEGGARAARAINEVFQDAYRGAVQERTAALWVAERAYIAMMANKPQAANEFDFNLYKDSLMGAMGVVRIGGKDFGGLTSYRRKSVQAPSWMVSSDFEKVWSNLTVDNWRAMGIPVFDDRKRGAVVPKGGVPLSKIRLAQPVTHGDGVYLLRFPDGRDYGRNNQRMHVTLKNAALDIAKRFPQSVR
ncbi:MAG: hypothetical protein RLZZ157_93 [Pseudomonadota bacterium]|jgi:hypothetical protein